MHPAGASVEKRAVRSQYCSVVLRQSTATKEHWVIPGSKRESLRTSGVLVDSAWLLILGNWRDVLINEGSGVNASKNAIYSMNCSGVLHPFSDLQERWRKHWRKWFKAQRVNHTCNSTQPVQTLAFSNITQTWLMLEYSNRVSLSFQSSFKT